MHVFAARRGALGISTSWPRRRRDTPSEYPRRGRGVAATQGQQSSKAVFVASSSLRRRFLLGYTLRDTFLALAPAMLLHAAAWNALHPNMHALPDITWREGVPSSWLAWARSSWFFRFLYTNHEGHHVVGGRGNYNVACPGTDHLVGTFIKEAAWRPRCRTTYATYHGEDMSVEQQIANHVARESFGLKSEAPPPSLVAA